MRHRSFTIALVVLCALASAEGLGGGIGRRLAVERAYAVLAAVPGLAIGRISASAGALAFDDLDLRSASGTRVHVGQLTLPSARASFGGFVASAAAKPAAITATDVSITVAHAVVTIPRIEIQGSFLTAERLKALLDPAADLSGADRLKELTAASLVAPSVTITAVPPATGGTRTTNADDDGKAVLDEVVLTDVVAGRIGAATIGKVSVFKSAAAGAPTIATLGPLDVNRLDLPLALRIVQTGRADRAEPPRAVYGSFSLRNLMLAPDTTATIRIGTIAADGLRGRPLLRRPADILALFQKSGSTQTPDDVRTLVDIALDAAKGFSLDHLEWDDVDVSGVSKGPFSLKLGRMTIDGMTPSQVGTWTLSDVAVTSDEASYSLARMALHAPDQSRLLDLFAHEFVTSGLAMDRSRLIGGVPEDGSLTMLGTHFEIANDEQPGNSPDGHRTVVDLPVVSFASETDPASKIATATAHIRGIYPLPTTSTVPGFAALVRSGFKGLDTRADYRMTFDPNGGEIRLDPLAIAADQLGRISVSAGVGHVPFDLLAQGRPSSDAQAAIKEVVFRTFSFDFINDGIVEMALPVLAASAGTSVPMLKVAAKTQSDLFIGQTLGDGPVAQRLEAAIDAFIDKPKSLHIAVTAPAGLTAAEIQAAPDPKVLLDRIGVEAVANR